MLRLVSRSGWWCCALLCLAACGGGSSDSVQDAGQHSADAGRPGTDAGADAGTDAGTGSDSGTGPEGNAGTDAGTATDAGSDAGTPPVESSVPMERVTLQGSPYLAWHRPGDTFRIVCAEPCPVEEPYIQARYAGFLAVKDELLSLTGIDVLPRMTPVDIHLAGDSICGAASDQFAGTSFMNWSASEVGPGSNVCLWDLEASQRPPPYVARPLTVENALARDNQVLLVHEYSHILFFLRHELSYEWLVRALSYRVGGLAPSLCDTMNHEFSPTAWELCQRTGFDFKQLAASLSELDALYAAGAGTENMYAGVPRSTTVYQFRRVLDRLTGSATLAAFIAGGELRANQCGDSARFTPEGGVVGMYQDAVRWELPAGALSASVDVQPGSWRTGKLVPDAWNDFMWANDYDFEPASLSFAAPARLTLRYDPRLIPAGGTEASLTLYRAGSYGYVPMADAQVDGAAHTVSATVPGLGRYVLAPR